jgi:hypothetical protein
VSLYTVQIKGGPIFNVRGDGIVSEPDSGLVSVVTGEEGKRVFTAPSGNVDYIKELQP